MTLVPSRLLPLNGNKSLNIMSLLLILCLFFNCGITKNTPKDQQLDYGKEEYGNGEYDPISRNEQPEEETINYPATNVEKEEPIVATDPPKDYETPTEEKVEEKTESVEKEETESKEPEEKIVDIKITTKAERSTELKDLKVETTPDSKVSEEESKKELDWVDIDRNPTEKEDTSIVNQIKKDIEAQLKSGSVKKPSEVNPEDLMGGMLSDVPMKKDAYKIAILLPFFTNKFGYPHGSISKDSKMALDFYEGAKLAFDKLRTEGVNLNISVFDTKGEKSTVEYLLQRSEVLNADVIIGPVTKDNSRLVSEFCVMNNKTLISPLNRRGDIVRQNPFYVQVNPSMERHYETLLKHIYKSHGQGNTLIIAPEGRTGNKRVEYINNANLVAGQSNIQSVMVDPRSAGNTEFDISGYLVSGGNNIVIVPSSSQSFVNFIMRELSKIRHRYPMIVLGMHQWEHFDKVDYNYYENLKVHISSDFYLNKADHEYRSFKTSYYGIYGSNPSENAVKGYDILLYFSRMIHKYGVYPQHHISGESAQYLHTRFEINPKYAGNASAAEQGSAIGSYENKFVNILKFEDFQFRRVN